MPTDPVHPIKLPGNWEVGCALDVHTISSQLLGLNEFGHEMFATERSQIGELLYRFKYRQEMDALPEIVRLVVGSATFKTIDAIIPVPPSNLQRGFQPVAEIAKALGAQLQIPVLIDVVRKVKETPELKNVGDLAARQRLLDDAFQVSPPGVLEGKTVLLKVFIGGSRRLGRLSPEVRRRLDNIIQSAFTILVGDANGVDKAVQSHCAESRYPRVVVFFAGNVCRNNVGGWETRRVEVERKTKDFRFYMAKDLQMAHEADYGFMIWDGESTGTLANMLELLDMGKKVLVHFSPEGSLVKLRSLDELAALLEKCPPEAVALFQEKLDLDDRIEKAGTYQPSLFPQSASVGG